MSVNLVGLELESEGVEYTDYSICPKCGGSNEVTPEDTIDGLICECETKCKICFHRDYWAYGWYQSAEEEPND